MEFIYHVTTAAEWQKALDAGFYEAPSLHSEGFIHCSTAEQVAGVLQRYFAGQNSLVLLHLPIATLSSPLKFEASPSLQEDFPHIYGRIPVADVAKSEAIENNN